LHKTKGNDAFKLGNYGDAEEAFNRAITSLPTNHLLLVPLHTNRALTRLRNGNPKGCVEDSSSALEIINDDPRQGEVFPIPNQDPIKLDDAFVKALRRRAEGYEALEKWESARSDWERLAGTSWAPGNQRGESSKGIGRCRKMLQPQPPTSSSPSAPPVASRSRAPPPRPSRPQSDLALLTAEPSEKVARLREANSALESEDNQRHVLKDSVDAKLATWSAGKEANLRVLLANLDTILWEDLRWKKIGMAELVTESQVKINYTKAIAKVHPDKVSLMFTISGIYC
jgi:tetratricopeptide (TPR) repeat protein